LSKGTVCSACRRSSVAVSLLYHKEEVSVVKALRVAWAFGLLGLMIYGAYVLLSTAWRILEETNPQLSAPVTTAGAALIVAVVTVVGGKWLERSATIAKELRDKKTPVYEDLLRFMFRQLTSSQQGSPITPEETVGSLAEFTQRLLVWGSDPVVAAWVRFRQGGNGDPMRRVLTIEGVISAIRRDLGHRNANLAPGDLSSLFVFDAKHVFETNDAGPPVDTDVGRQEAFIGP